MSDPNTSNKPYSVLIPDGESFFALPVVQCLGQIENVRIYVLSNNRTAAIRFSRYTTKYFIYPAGPVNQEKNQQFCFSFHADHGCKTFSLRGYYDHLCVDKP